MESKAPVFIGMPVLNGSHTIRRALDSLLRQTHTDFQIVVVDNSSDDESFDIAMSYANKDDRVEARRLPRVGAGESFSRSIQFSSSKYVMWAADDDTWEPTFLATAVDLMESGDLKYCSVNWWVGDVANNIGTSQETHPLWFLNNPDRKIRALNFANLHHHSHKANLVYALYERSFLSNALNLQSIENDGVFANIVAAEGRGEICHSVLFRKQYSQGVVEDFLRKLGLPLTLAPHLRRLIRGNASRQSDFSLQKTESLQKLMLLFPEYGNDLIQIYEAYRSNMPAPYIIEPDLWLV